MAKTTPEAFFGAPAPVFLPTNLPSVRVVAVNGEGIPEVPTGSFEPTDITIDKATAAMVMIEARNIPAGTVVQLHVFSEDGEDQIVDSTPLEEQPTGELTATADVLFPLGFSRAFVRAKWTNP